MTSRQGRNEFLGPLWGLYREYCRHPFPHSLKMTTQLSTRQMRRQTMFSKDLTGDTHTNLSRFRCHTQAVPNCKAFFLRKSRLSLTDQGPSFEPRAGPQAVLRKSSWPRGPQVHGLSVTAANFGMSPKCCRRSCCNAMPLHTPRVREYPIFEVTNFITN